MKRITVSLNKVEDYHLEIICDYYYWLTGLKISKSEIIRKLISDHYSYVLKDKEFVKQTANFDYE